jgi:hypothetical protein
MRGDRATAFREDRTLTNGLEAFLPCRAGKSLPWRDADGGMHCFPQCMPVIHSTHANNLRRTVVSYFGRTSSVRRQNAISRSGFSRSRHLKPRLAANQGLAAPGARIIPDAGARRCHHHVHGRDANGPSVLSSSLARASPLGHGERVMTALPCRGMFPLRETLCPVLRPDHRPTPVGSLLGPRSPSTVFESRG